MLSSGTLDAAAGVTVWWASSRVLILRGNKQKISVFFFAHAGHVYHSTSTTIRAL